MGIDVSGTHKKADETDAANATDQSMEDILASIRRILSEDEMPTAMTAQAGAEEIAVAESTFGDGVTEQAKKPAAPLTLDASMMIVSPLHSKDEKVNEVTAVTKTSDNLVSSNTATAAASSISSLVQALSTQRATPVFRDGPTIEDLVREEIRPIVQQWMDQYLPQIVERLVRAEIERVIARATS